MGKTIALVLVLVFLTSLVTLQPATVKAQSKTIVVPDEYPTIQAAIDNASAGDIVFVKEGTYYENLRIDKSMQLIGEDAEKTILDGNLSASTGFPPTMTKLSSPLTIIQDNVTVEGFTLRNAYTGIQLGGNHCTISGNRITNVQYGIELFNASENSLTGNVIDSIKTNGYAIEVSHSSDNNIKVNQINSASIGTAITDQLLSRASVILTKNNNVSENNIENSKDCAIMLQFTNNNNFNRNNISTSKVGVSIYVANNNNFSNNDFINNTQQISADEWYATQWGYSVSTNTWNGNYWSDYHSKYANATELDASGVGNTPYVIEGNNTDYYPLVKQVDVSVTSPTVPEFSWLDILPLFLFLPSVALILKHRKIQKKASRVF